MQTTLDPEKQKQEYSRTRPDCAVNAVVDPVYISLWLRLGRTLEIPTPAHDFIYAALLP